MIKNNIYFINMKQIFPFLFFLSIFPSLAQEITGVILDENKDPLYGVLVENHKGDKARSDLEGSFTIKAPEYPLTLKFSIFDYHSKEIVLKAQPTEIFVVEMKPEAQELEGIVVSASRRKQKIEEVTISLEIIKPELIENKGITNVEHAVNQAPGAYTMDGQVSIRGGSGFSYGAGSRVMAVWNDIPLLSADAGDIKWESIGLENIAQIEVLKGASSVLYGSGALNGIVSLKDKDPTIEGETKVSYQIGIYDNPRRSSLKWSSKALLSNQISAYHGKMLKNFGYTVSAYGFMTDGYRAGVEARRGRLNGGFIFKPKKMNRLKAGLNYSFSMEDKGIFLIWESDSLGYYPLGGSKDLYSDSSTLSIVEAFRAMIDPYVVYFDKYNNKHNIQGRFYNTTNVSGENSAKANMSYIDYKFDRNFNAGFHLTAGLTGQWGDINSVLYGNHKSQNYSFYGQLDKTFGRVTLTAGVRGEYYRANDLEPDSKLYLSKDSTKSINIRPIFRAGLHYKAFENTHIRASFGQAYRYPSIAERFASTSMGAVNIIPNSELKSERGWSAELGIKQGYKIGNFKGFIDLAGFINEYKNMIEFTFGFHKPDSITVMKPEDVPKWFGFKAQNAEKARIIGAELSINGIGNIGDVEISALMGYTYMNPIVLDPDSVYVYGDALIGNGGLSNPDSKMLKYRFRHLAKGDIQLKYKGIILGFGARYNSFMENIDKTFEEGAIIFPGTPPIPVLNGLKEYRQEQQKKKGDLVFDFRVGYQFKSKYQIHFIVNNLFNVEYMTRPGDIQAPRQFVLRFQADL